MSEKEKLIRLIRYLIYGYLGFLAVWYIRVALEYFGYL